MSLSDILYLIIKYLDYKSLLNLSSVVKIDEYLWNQYLDQHYIHSLNSKDLFLFLQKNSIKLKSKRREDIKKLFDYNKISFDVSIITRLFVYNFYDNFDIIHRIVFMTSNLEYYKYSNFNKRITLIDFNKILSVISLHTIDARIRLDRQNGYSLKQIHKFGIYNVIKFKGHNIPRGLYYLKEYYGVINDVITISEDVHKNINMKELIDELYDLKCEHKERNKIFPYKSLKTEYKDDPTIFYYNFENIKYCFYLYYECCKNISYHPIFKKTYSFTIITRSDLSKLIEVISKEKLDKLNIGI
jgi:hypothetical protein